MIYVPSEKRILMKERGQREPYGIVECAPSGMKRGDPQKARKYPPRSCAIGMRLRREARKITEMMFAFEFFDGFASGKHNVNKDKIQRLLSYACDNRCPLQQGRARVPRQDSPPSSAIIANDSNLSEQRISTVLYTLQSITLSPLSPPSSGFSSLRCPHG